MLTHHQRTIIYSNYVSIRIGTLYFSIFSIGAIFMPFDPKSIHFQVIPPFQSLSLVASYFLKSIISTFVMTLTL